MSTDDTTTALTAADYVAGLRALADAIEASGLPADVEFPTAELGMNFYVNSPAAVQEFATAHGLTARVSGTHTTATLTTGPHPTPHREGSVQLTVLHIDHPVGQEHDEAPEPVLNEGDDGDPFDTHTAPSPEPAPYLPDTPGYEWVIDAEGEPIDVREVIDADEPTLDRALRTVTLPPADDRAVVEAVARGASSQAGLQAVMHGPTIPSGGAVKSTPALSDGNTGRGLDDPRAAAAALHELADAAIEWHDADPDQPAGIAAEESLSSAIETYRKAVGR